MIARIIELALKNRAMVLLLTAMLVGGGIFAVFQIRLDAIPDLSDVQVIVTTEYPGQNPEVVEQQITYPLTTAMLAVSGSTVVRGFSMFEQSFVYVLFEDGTDIDWARRYGMLDCLNFARDQLPAGVEPKLGPDATGVGWVYQYVLYPGFYSKDHEDGLLHDPLSKRWFERAEDSPEEARSRLVKVRAWEAPGKDPLTGSELVPPVLESATRSPRLVSAISTHVGSRMSPRSPRSAASSSSTRWSWIRSVSKPSASRFAPSSTRLSGRTRTSAAPSSNSPRTVHGAEPGISERP